MGVLAGLAFGEAGWLLYYGQGEGARSWDKAGKGSQSRLREEPGRQGVGTQPGWERTRQSQTVSSHLNVLKPRSRPKYHAGDPTCCLKLQEGHWHKLCSWVWGQACVHAWLLYDAYHKSTIQVLQEKHFTGEAMTGCKHTCNIWHKSTFFYLPSMDMFGISVSSPSPPSLLPQLHFPIAGATVPDLLLLSVLPWSRPHHLQLDPHLSQSATMTELGL